MVSAKIVDISTSSSSSFREASSSPTSEASADLKPSTHGKSQKQSMRLTEHKREGGSYPEEATLLAGILSS